MKLLSLKLRDEVFKEVEEVVKKFNIPRNAYINEALDFYNKVNRRRLLKKQLAKEVELARASSLEVLQEFESLGEEGLE
jgi:hypothetical protein